MQAVAKKVVPIKENLVKDSGVPESFVLTSLATIPFLGAFSIFIYTHQSEATRFLLCAVSLTAMMLQLFAISFYWRRLKQSTLKLMAGYWCMGATWAYMFALCGVVALTSLGGAEFIRYGFGLGLGLLCTSTGLFTLAWLAEQRGTHLAKALVVGFLSVLLSVGMLGAAVAKYLPDLTALKHNVAGASQNVEEELSDIPAAEHHVVAAGPAAVAHSAVTHLEAHKPAASEHNEHEAQHHAH